MSVWLAIPSIREGAGLVMQWWRSGYKIALWREISKPIFEAWPHRTDPYPGYAIAVNELVKAILKEDAQAEWIVTGGDDTSPDPNHTPDEIAAELEAHFGGTFGVCQPTGDRFAGGSIDTIAGSPWMGREWCLRANQGRGPLWPEFQHMFVDQHLMCVAEKLGVYWRRPDLIHFHDHFMRKSADLNSPAVQKPIPSHLQKWNTQRHWDESKAIFERLKAQNFAPCMPLPVEVCA